MRRSTLKPASYRPHRLSGLEWACLAVIVTMLSTLVAMLASADLSPEERDRLIERHRWIHNERAYERDLDIDRECAVCHEPAALQLFRKKHAQRAKQR